MQTILFICTGNTCRSPMAEAIGQRWIDAGHLSATLGEQRLLAASAGVSAANGVPPSVETTQALAKIGCDFDGRSKRLTAEMIRRARVIFGMTAEHVAAARALVPGEPDEQAKIIPLDPEIDIEDPIGMRQSAYDALAQRFTELIPKRLQEVFANEDRAGIGSSRA